MPTLPTLIKDPFPGGPTTGAPIGVPPATIFTDMWNEIVDIVSGDSTSKLPTDAIADLAVTALKIANLAVTTGKLDDLAVTTLKIANGAITLLKMANGTPGAILKFNGTTGVIEELGIGGALQRLRVNAGGTDLEYFTAAADSDEQVNVFEGGTQVGTQARQLDFTDNDFNITEDSGNNQFDVDINRNSANGIAGLDATSRLAKAQQHADTVYTDDAQTLTNKTIDLTANTVDDSGALGDLIKHNGSKYINFPKGTALQVLRVNAGGTDLEFNTVAGAPHDLLDGATAQDTVANTPTLGSLIKANGTPLWDEFTIGTSLQNIRVNAAGTDLEYFTPVSTFVLGFGRDEGVDGAGTEFAQFYGDEMVGTESDSHSFLGFAFTVKRSTLYIGTNTSDDTLVTAVRDDLADLATSVITVPAGVTGSFDSGLITEPVAAASLINMRYTRNGSTTIADFVGLVECEK